MNSENLAYWIDDEGRKLDLKFKALIYADNYGDVVNLYAYDGRFLYSEPYSKSFEFNTFLNNAKRSGVDLFYADIPFTIEILWLVFNHRVDLIKVA